MPFLTRYAFETTNRCLIRNLKGAQSSHFMASGALQTSPGRRYWSFRIALCKPQNGRLEQ